MRATLKPVVSATLERAGQVLISIGEEGLELIAALLVLVMVERTHGTEGLGIFAYLTGCMAAVRYLANFGVARHVEIETVRLPDKAGRDQLVSRGFQATVLAGFAAALLLLITAGLDTAHTRIQERVAAYVILALILPVANINTLKLAVMQGLGHHGRVARLRMHRHTLVLAGVFVLTRFGCAPSYLLIAHLSAEIMMARSLRGQLQFPKLRSAFKHIRTALATWKQGRVYLFTDRALDLLLNIDLFILGIFVDAWSLGLYTQAAVLVRICLAVAVGIRPILRRQYTLVETRESHVPLATMLRRHAAVLFSLQSALALMTLLHFPALLDLVFEFGGESVRSFHLFLVFVPGLIFYSTFFALEPVYEAIGRPDRLERLTVQVTILNLILNLLLVPAAGVYGAAEATMLTMLAHFFLFGRGLPPGYAPDRLNMITAALAIYLIYKLFQALALTPALTLWLPPLLLVAAFFGCGLFGASMMETQPVGFSITQDGKETKDHGGKT